jgi:hypothetical protein
MCTVAGLQDGQRVVYCAQACMHMLVGGLNQPEEQRCNNALTKFRIAKHHWWQAAEVFVCTHFMTSTAVIVGRYDIGISCVTSVSSIKGRPRMKCTASMPSNQQQEKAILLDALRRVVLS